MSAKVAGCFACESPVLPVMANTITKSDDLALCTTHWNWWLCRWLNAEDEPPCAAHLIEPEPSDGVKAEQASLVPTRCKTCGWLLSDTNAHIDAMYDDHSGQAEPARAWRDKQGDVWKLGDDGLLHTPETRPFSREHVEKKWGPLVPEPTTTKEGE